MRQQILFGPTLWPYVLGEQIGGTLLAEAKLLPRIMLVDHPAALCLRARIAVPMVRIEEAASSKQEPGNVPVNDCEIGRCRFELPTGFEADREVVIELLVQLAQHIELVEPFDRIREAIREAQRLGARGQDAHEQAA